MFETAIKELQLAHSTLVKDESSAWAASRVEEALTALESARPLVAILEIGKAMGVLEYRYRRALGRKSDTKTLPGSLVSTNLRLMTAWKDIMRTQQATLRPE